MLVFPQEGHRIAMLMQDDLCDLSLLFVILGHNFLFLLPTYMQH
jgi:hypothetical protein